MSRERGLSIIPGPRVISRAVCFIRQYVVSGFLEHMVMYVCIYIYIHLHSLLYVHIKLTRLQSPMPPEVVTLTADLC